MFKRRRAAIALRCETVVWSLLAAMATQQLQLSDQGITTGGNPLPCIESPCSAVSETCTAANVTTPDDKDKIDQSTKRGCFEEAVRKTLNIPSGYVKVAVLVLRWHPDVDDFAEEHTYEVSLHRRYLRSPGCCSPTDNKYFVKRKTITRTETGRATIPVRMAQDIS
jgi:hypothetical protein